MFRLPNEIKTLIYISLIIVMRAFCIMCGPVCFIFWFISGDCSCAVCDMVLCGVHFWFVVHLRFRETISGLTLLSE